MLSSRNIGTVLLRIATLAVAPVQNVGDEVRMYLYMRTSKDGSVLQWHARHCELACLLELYRKLKFVLSLCLSFVFRWCLCCLRTVRPTCVSE